MVVGKRKHRSDEGGVERGKEVSLGNRGLIVGMRLANPRKPFTKIG